MNKESPKYRRVYLLNRIHRSMTHSHVRGMFVNIKGHLNTKSVEVKDLLNRKYAEITINPDHQWFYGRRVSIIVLTKLGKAYLKRNKHMLDNI